MVQPSKATSSSRVGLSAYNGRQPIAYTARAGARGRFERLGPQVRGRHHRLETKGLLVRRYYWVDAEGQRRYVWSSAACCEREGPSKSLTPLSRKVQRCWSPLDWSPAAQRRATPAPEPAQLADRKNNTIDQILPRSAVVAGCVFSPHALVNRSGDATGDQGQALDPY